MLFSFNHLELPPLTNKMTGPQYENMKRTIVSLMLGQRLEVFSSESSNAGRWPSLAAQTMRGRLEKVPKARRNDIGAVRMLVDKGILRQSFTDSAGPGTAFREERTDGDEVSIATHVPYTAIHNYGGTISHPGTSNGFGRKIKIRPHLIAIPARPFDQFTPDHEDQIGELVEGYLNG